MKEENEFVPGCLCITDMDPCEEYVPGFQDGPCVTCGHEEACHDSEMDGVMQKIFEEVAAEEG